MLLTHPALTAYQPLFIVGKKSPAELCQTASAQSSCGQCIKQHPDCAWCSDPNADLPSRCELYSSLEKKCEASFVEHPVSKVEFLQNADVGASRQDPYSGAIVRTQLQPQQVQIAMKPGDAISFSLRYLHQDRDSRDIYILNSETESQGVTIEYEAECRGIVQPGNFCPSVSHSDVVSFNVSVKLRECRASGGAVVSVGIGGVREVVALYVNPICGCDCEKLENQVGIAVLPMHGHWQYQRPFGLPPSISILTSDIAESPPVTMSPQCGGRGNLVCGACICNPGSAGSRCECNVASGTMSVAELLNQCRSSPSEEPCSGRGKCKCGACECDSPEKYSGKYCQCDDTSCPSNGAELCSGRGRCECGTCKCDVGWTGPACDCTTETTECLGKSGMICNGQGSCDCGKCACNDGYSGPTCELCLNCEAETEFTEGDDYHTLLPEKPDEIEDLEETPEAKPKVESGASVVSLLPFMEIVTLATLLIIGP
ncbi:EGF-like domain protein [Trichuris suis]|nr:EGF-like domain protein [Trichuris suis]